MAIDMKTLLVFGVILIAAVAAGAGVVYWLGGDKAAVTETKTTETVKTIVEAGGKDNFCANNPKLDFNVRVHDALDTTTLSYLNGTIYVVNKDTGSITEQSVTSGGTTAFTTVSNIFDCKSVNGYDIYVKFDGTTNSNGKITLTADDLVRDPIEKTIEGTAYTPFKVKCYDENDKAKCKSTADNSTEFVTSLTSNFQSNDGTTFDGTADQSIDLTFTLQPNVTNAAKGTAMLIGLNTEDSSNLADFDETLLQIWYDNVLLSEASGLEDNELRAMNDYEQIYKVANPIGMSFDAESNMIKSVERKLRVYLNTESGQSADFDPVIKLVAIGDYQSTKGDKVFTGIGFKDNTARTELASAQTITIKVA